MVQNKHGEVRVLVGGLPLREFSFRRPNPSSTTPQQNDPKDSQTPLPTTRELFEKPNLLDQNINKIFVTALPGATYSIKVTNFTLEVVAALVLIDNKPANGITLLPLQSHNFTGFFVDNQAVREFVFGTASVADSTQNSVELQKLGSITVVFFQTRKAEKETKQLSIDHTGVILPKKVENMVGDFAVTRGGDLIRCKTTPSNFKRAGNPPFAVFRVLYRTERLLGLLGLRGIPWNEPERWKAWAIERISNDLSRCPEELVSTPLLPRITAHQRNRPIRPLEIEHKVPSDPEGIASLVQPSREKNLRVVLIEDNNSFHRSLSTVLFETSLQFELVRDSIDLELREHYHEYDSMSIEANKDDFSLQLIAFCNFWRISISVISSVHPGEPFFYSPQFNRFPEQSFWIGQYAHPTLQESRWTPLTFLSLPMTAPPSLQYTSLDLFQLLTGPPTKRSRPVSSEEKSVFQSKGRLRKHSSNFIDLS